MWARATAGSHQGILPSLQLLHAATEGGLSLLQRSVCTTCPLLSSLAGACGRLQLRRQLSLLVLQPGAALLLHRAHRHDLLVGAPPPLASLARGFCRSCSCG